MKFEIQSKDVTVSGVGIARQGAICPSAAFDTKLFNRSSSIKYIVSLRKVEKCRSR